MVKAATRREALAFSGAAIALGLAGCAADDLSGNRAIRRLPGAASANGLLTPWLSITGGWRTEPQQTLQLAPKAGPRLMFTQPVGVAVRGDVLLVADAGARTLWRLDRNRDSMAPFAPFTGGTLEQGASLQLGNDYSVWVALPAEHSVVQYDFRARELLRWRDDANVPRPVAVVVPDGRIEILVGDSATSQIVVFSPLGRTLYLLGGSRVPVLQSVAAMALGPAGLYVLDRVAQQVVVLDTSGNVVEIIGENHLVRPRALAVDRSGRVFVSDDVDQRISVFRGAKLLGTAGGLGGGPDRFGRIEAMAVDGNMLYVADSLNARVQVMLIAPPSMEGPGAVR